MALFVRNKYGVASKTDRTCDDIVFDSKKEMNRWQELRLLQSNGDIWELKRQPRFDIIVNGVKIGFYKADFWYVDKGGAVVEDVKGVRTPLYKLKKKLVEALYGFEITEV